MKQETITAWNAMFSDVPADQPDTRASSPDIRELWDIENRVNAIYAWEAEDRRHKK